MMTKKAGDIKKVLYPIIKLGPYIKAMWLSNKEITVLIDDTIDDSKEKKNLEKAIKKCSPPFKFSKNKSLSIWWELVRNAEPKALEELKNLRIIYDPSDYVKLLKHMVEKGTLFTSGKKASILLQSAKNSLINTEEILLRGISGEIFKAMTGTAQAFLLYIGEFASEPEEILSALERLSKKSGIDKSFFDAYKEIYDEIKEIDEGKVDELTAKDANYFISLAKHFMFGTEDLIASFEKDRSDKVMRKAYLFCLDLCKEALRNKYRLVPLRDDEKIRLFKEHYVDTGIVDITHYTTLETLHRYSVSDKRGRQSLGNEKALDRSRINNLSLVLQNIVGE